MASRWLVFIGSILCFTPLFPIGICLIAWYVIDLLFRNGSTLVNTGKQTPNEEYEKTNYLDKKKGDCNNCLFEWGKV